MSIIYPCQVSHCQIHCPCSFCSDLRKFRRQPCGQLGWRSQAALCHQACNRVQCKEHKILLGRLFNIKTDQFTIVTSRLTELRFALPYAGIPFSCIPCTQDLKEHQIYHLVSHTLCKFCRWETRSLGIKSAMGPVTSIAVYKDATELLEVSKEVTCATCYETFDKEKIRKKHEMFHHGGVKITLNVV